MRKYTNEEFIIKAKEYGHDNYKYDKCKYNDDSKFVMIGCKNHGYVNVYKSKLILSSLKNQDICPLCRKEKNHHIGYKYNKKELIYLLNKKYSRYDNIDISHTLDNVDLNKGVHQRVNVICKKHGIYSVLLYHLIQGWECKECNKENRWKNKAKNNYDYWIQKFKEKWPDYDYSLTVPTISKCYDKYKIICPNHGIQEIVARTFLKNGCPKCNNGQNFIKRDYTNKEFINELKNIWKDKYDFSLVEYKDPKHKIKVICPKHGLFYREPIRMINNEHKGCPYCHESFLENDIDDFLKNNCIEFIRQFKIQGSLKRLDFFLPKYKCGIECQGRQHFYQNSIFNKKENIEDIYKLDKDKYELFNSNNIKIFYYTNINYKKDYFQKLYYNKEELLKDIIEYGKSI